VKQARVRAKKSFEQKGFKKVSKKAIDSGRVQLTDKGSGINWSQVIRKLPTKKGNARHSQRRKDMFMQFDPNGNGYLSLAEVDKGIRDVLALDALFNAKPAIMRAFQYAKDWSEGDGKYGPDFIEFKEFRILLVALKQYLEYWEAFGKVDTSGDGRITIDEFSAAVDLISSWVGDIPNPDAEFLRIDANRGGFILFNEFCDWAIRKNLAIEKVVYDIDSVVSKKKFPGQERLIKFENEEALAPLKQKFVGDNLGSELVYNMLPKPFVRKARDPTLYDENGKLYKWRPPKRP